MGQVINLQDHILNHIQNIATAWTMDMLGTKMNVNSEITVKILSWFIKYKKYELLISSDVSKYDVFLNLIICSISYAVIFSPYGLIIFYKFLLEKEIMRKEFSQKNI